jgi:hypothetical protein
MVSAYIIEFTVFALLIIGLTAFLGPITNGIGEKLFSRKDVNYFVDKSAGTQTGWRDVGGRKNK